MSSTFLLECPTLLHTSIRGPITHVRLLELPPVRVHNYDCIY
jgi:hypothetical protein